MSAFGKEIRRSITHSLGRFIALFAITALGVGFYAGLRMTGPDMRSAADIFLDDARFMDVRVLSTMGVDAEDIAALAAVEGVEMVMPAYETDILGTLNDEQYVFRMHSLPTSRSASGLLGSGPRVATSAGDYLNNLMLIRGSWPTRPDECLISADRVMTTPPQIGDVIAVTGCSGDLDATLEVRYFTVCGFVKSADYVSGTSLGTSSLGSGTVQHFMYVPETAFAEDFPYTDIYIRVEGAAATVNGSEEYKALVDAVEARIRDMVPALALARTERVKAPYYAELDDAEAELQEGMATWEEGKAEYDANASSYEGQLAQWQAGMNQYRAGQRQYNDGLATYQRAYEAAQRLYEAAVANAGQEAADELFARAFEELAAQKAQLDAAKAQLDATWGQLAWAKAQLDAAAGILDDAKTELDDAKAELDSGASDIAAARQELDDMAPAEYYVLDRPKNYGLVSYDSDSYRIDSIARVFPFIFFLVAALVALTTMTRMVEEERSLIGTYKALGYGKWRITSKYLIYAASASILGSATGIVSLSQVLPKVICTAYNIVYFVPESTYPIDWPLAIMAAALGIGVVLVATYGAAAATLRERPSALLLPRAPKAGKRIMLEYFGPIWERMSFSWKVTCRNLFRYKKRLIMTVIGIAGCTMLLLTGWGLRDAINDIIDVQFGRIVRYNLTISTDDELTPEADAALAAIMADETYVTESTPARKLTLLAVPDNGTDLMVEVIIPKSRMAFADFLEIRERTTGRWLELEYSGVVVTEKLATLLHAEVGDRITLFDEDATGNRTSTSHTMRVAGIMENYVYNYVYMSADLYAEIFGEPPVFNMVMVQATEDPTLREELTGALREIEGVRTVSYNDEIIDTYRTMLKSVDMITWVLIVAAAALAFIVLYNLTNINITERQREIATLKVLGFTRHEVYAYIYREVALLTVLGALVGLALGVWLEGWVVVTAEVDQVMFGRSIHWASYVISLVLTGVFAALVMFIMRRKLDRVNMVESLKSVE